MKDSVSKEDNTKSKAQLKAERRAIQEAQRAAKAASKGTDKPKVTQTPNAAPNAPNTLPNQDTGMNEQKTISSMDEKACIGVVQSQNNRLDYSSLKIAEVPKSRTQESCRVHLFKHLDQPDKRCRGSFLSAIVEFRRGSIYLAGDEIVDRTVNLIRSGECVCIFGYSSLVARVLERAWKSPCNTSVNQVDANVDFLADKMKTCFVNTKSDPSNKTANRVFSVLVVDSRPKFEGRQMLTRLLKAGIPCEYTHIGALPSVANKISLVILGAHALLSNGYVLGRMGSAQVANIAASISHAPTIVCAETYKFWERAHSDAFEYNELGDPDDIWRGPRGTSPDYKKGIPGFGPTGLPDRIESSTTDLSEWRSNYSLRLLHLEYDVLPPTLVTAVVTEKGTLPTTSVPVVLRVKQASITNV
ncbi:unnamed protein product [Schistosoma mattheei]|uniref:Translation initiation factor eIF2B subunit delta n=2 Tax=Schistosoma mattheei TaxID=31246 RepID=A0A183NWG9_9TREM|nr:unnamed protein product [Schistosoma mattheei]